MLDFVYGLTNNWIAGIVFTVLMPFLLFLAVKAMISAGEPDEERSTREFIELAAKKKYVVWCALVLIAAGICFMARDALKAGVLGAVISCLMFAIDILALALVCQVWRQHHEDVGEIWQGLPLAGVVACMGFVMAHTKDTMLKLLGIGHSPWSELFATLTWMIAIIVVGFCVGSVFSYRAQVAEEDPDPDEEEPDYKRYTTATKWVTIVALILVFLIGFLPALITSFGNNASQKASSKTTTQQTSTEISKKVPTETQANAGSTISTNEQKWLTYQEVTQKYPWLTWNNFALQSDGDPDNNANFGPDRHHKNWTATDYFQDMKTFDESDVLILIAHVAAVDAARDTRMVGDYYDGNNHDWARTMNALIAKCLSDKVDFMHFSEVYLNMLKYEVRSVRVVHMDDINDQMYITPYTYSGVPELVASETHQSGDVLIVTFKRKGGEENDVSVGFRIDCCYQPVGIIDIMKLPNTKVEIPPEHTPDNPVTPTSTPKSTDSPEPTPTPTDSPTPSYNKNPADDPVNQGNADKGGGDNKSSDGSGEYQKDDPRTTVQDPAEVKPKTPTVVPEHKADQDSGKLVDHENKMGYDPDPVTDRGPVNGGPATSEDGDGEYTPPD